MNNQNNKQSGFNTFIFLIIKMILVYIRMLISMWTIYMYNFLQTFLYYRIKNRLLSHLITFIILSTFGFLSIGFLINKYDINIYHSPYLFMYY